MLLYNNGAYRKKLEKEMVEILANKERRSLLLQ
jgi:hypothetical protein